MNKVKVFGKLNDGLAVFAIFVFGLALASPLLAQEAAGPEPVARQTAEEGQAKAQPEEQRNASAAPVDPRAWLGDIYLRLPLQLLWPELGGLAQSLLGLGLAGQLDLNLAKDRIQRIRGAGIPDIQFLTIFWRFGLAAQLNLAQLSPGRPGLRADEHRFSGSLSWGQGLRRKTKKYFAESILSMKVDYDVFSRGAQDLSRLSLDLLGLSGGFGIWLGDSLFRVDAYIGLLSWIHFAEDPATFYPRFLREGELALSLLLPPLSDRLLMGPQLGIGTDIGGRKDSALALLPELPGESWKTTWYLYLAWVLLRRSEY